MLAYLRSIRLTTWIMIALVSGIALGVLCPDLAHQIKPLRTVFLNAVKCIIAPLIFASIVVGVNASGGVRGLSRTGIRAVIWFEAATAVALVLGLLFVNLLRPGDGLSVGKLAPVDLGGKVAGTLNFAGFIEHLVPTNIAEAVVKGDVLQIVLFSILFGLGVMLAGEKGKAVLDYCEGLNVVMFKCTELIMSMAPIGVGAAIAGSVAEHGVSVLWPMAKMVGTLYLALAFFVGLVMVPALIWARVRLDAFWREFRSPILLAFATTSSESAFPSTLEGLERMGIPRRISSFVLPLGYSFNLDGSTLYLAIASVFIAQAAHIELSLWTQLTMMLTLMVTTKGVAAVPRASIVVLSATLTAFNLPLEGVALILGVDEFMDMARTATNLLGNCVATCVVARSEGARLNPAYSTDPA